MENRASVDAPAREFARGGAKGNRAGHLNGCPINRFQSQKKKPSGANRPGFSRLAALTRGRRDRAGPKTQIGRPRSLTDLRRGSFPKDASVTPARRPLSL